MDDYQKSIVARFFEPYPTLSPLSCHQFALDHVAPVLFPSTPDKVDIRPSSFQGSMSYTAILSSAHDQRIVVQFRGEKHDLFGMTEAHRIHGSLVPLVTFRGMHGILFVYTSPFVAGTPYIQCLLSSPDSKLPLRETMATVLDIADIITRGLRANAAAIDLSSLLDGIKSRADSYPFRNSSLRSNILICINKILPQLHNLTDLPVALTHQDLSPFNYLIDESTGRVRAVLDWDGALYLMLGSNFHFVESFFGYMTQQGWEDNEDGQELELAFYARVSSNVAAQGFVGATKDRLDLAKAVGMLDYYLKQVFKLKDGWSEQHLEGYLQRLTFMRGLM